MPRKKPTSAIEQALSRPSTSDERRAFVPSQKKHYVAIQCKGNTWVNVTFDVALSINRLGMYLSRVSSDEMAYADKFQKMIDSSMSSASALNFSEDAKMIGEMVACAAMLDSSRAALPKDKSVFLWADQPYAPLMDALQEYREEYGICDPMEPVPSGLTKNICILTEDRGLLVAPWQILKHPLVTRSPHLLDQVKWYCRKNMASEKQLREAEEELKKKRGVTFLEPSLCSSFYFRPVLRKSLAERTLDALDASDRRGGGVQAGTPSSDPYGEDALPMRGVVKMVEYIEYHNNSRGISDKDRRKWNIQFIRNLDRAALLDLASTAHHLDITDLLDLTCGYLAENVSSRGVPDAPSRLQSKRREKELVEETPPPTPTPSPSPPPEAAVGAAEVAMWQKRLKGVFKDLAQEQIEKFISCAKAGGVDFKEVLMKMSDMSKRNDTLLLGMLMNAAGMFEGTEGGVQGGEPPQQQPQQANASSGQKETDATHCCPHGRLVETKDLPGGGGGTESQEGQTETFESVTDLGEAKEKEEEDTRDVEELLRFIEGKDTSKKKKKKSKKKKSESTVKPMEHSVHLSSLPEKLCSPATLKGSPEPTDAGSTPPPDSFSPGREASAPVHTPAQVSVFPRAAPGSSHAFESMGMEKQEEEGEEEEEEEVRKEEPRESEKKRIALSSSTFQALQSAFASMSSFK